MGLVDSFAAEDRVEVKYSDFYKLVRAEAERALLKNAVFAGVPREQILKMLSGQNDELEEYRKTGLSPDQIREMDKFYAEKCKEVAITTAEKDVLKKQIEDQNHHGFVGTDTCPVCGEPVYDTYHRIVGFLEPRRTYSKDRKRVGR